MVDRFLVSKWKTWFKALDVRKDGVLSSKDAVLMRDTFEDLHHIDSKEREKVTKFIESWWKEFIFQGRTGQITEKQFIDLLEKEYLEDKVKFKDMMTRLYSTMIHCMDQDKDGQISEEDFLIIWKAFGHNDVEHLKQSFKEYSPVHGLVPVERGIREWVDFVTSEDPKKARVALHGFEMGVDVPTTKQR